SEQPENFTHLIQNISIPEEKEMKVTISPELETTTKESEIAPQTIAPEAKTTDRPEVEATTKAAELAPETVAPEAKTTERTEVEATTKAAEIAPETVAPEAKITERPVVEATTKTFEIPSVERVIPEQPTTPETPVTSIFEAIVTTMKSLLVTTPSPIEESTIVPSEQPENFTHLIQNISIPEEKEMKVTISPELETTTKKSEIAPETIAPEAKTTERPEVEATTKAA